MKHFYKIIALICIAVILTVSIIGCSYRGYRGDYVGAYTLIYSQVPDILGARASGPYLSDPQIILFEQDNTGRAMYLYIENTDGLISLCIVQKETDNEVYFYPEKSTLSFRAPDYIYDIDQEKIPEEKLKSVLNELCSSEIMEQFKADNDWNLPINENKLDSAKITTPKISARWEHRTDTVNLTDEKWMKQIFALALKNGHMLTEANEDHRYFSYASYMATDDYGRRLYYVEAYYYVYPENDSQIHYIRYFLEMIAIINPDGTFDSDTFMTELEDKTNYQEQIHNLKISNSWDQPLE